MHAWFFLQVRDELSSLLRQFIGDVTIPDGDRLIRHVWGSDKYARGTYSSPGLSARETDFETLAKPYFPDGSRKSGIFFAGEACSPNYWSFMQGARISGLKAADEVAGLLQG